LTADFANPTWDDPEQFDDWAVDRIPMLDRVILVAALAFAAAVIVRAVMVSAKSDSNGIFLAIPAVLAIVAIFTGWEYAYSPAIGLCLLFGILSTGMVAYVPLAGLLIARFVRAEYRRGESEPFSNGALGVMFFATSPIGFYLIWLGDGLISRILEGR
jgi:hypothetical protein